MYEWLWDIVCFMSLTLGAVANVRISWEKKYHHDTHP